MRLDATGVTPGMACTVIDTAARSRAGEKIVCKSARPRNVVKFVTLSRPVGSRSELMEDSMTSNRLYARSLYLRTVVAIMAAE